MERWLAAAGGGVEATRECGATAHARWKTFSTRISAGCRSCQHITGEGSQRVVVSVAGCTADVGRLNTTRPSRDRIAAMIFISRVSR